MKAKFPLFFCLIVFIGSLFSSSCKNSYVARQATNDMACSELPGLPVLPGVEGFGLDSKGGLNGTILKVTNLNKDGEGSLNEAIQCKGPRIIVFEVAGVINLEGNTLTISNPFVSLAGQTAPFPGITIIEGGIKIVTHDVILQHIKVRPGEAGHAKKSGWEVDGICTGGGAHNVIVDHCSATWATDENLSVSGPRFEGASVAEWRNRTSHKIIFSNCIIAEGLSNSTHSHGEHSKGSLIHDNVTEILLFGNLYANNTERNPLFKAGAQGAVINNYIYNPGNAAIDYSLVPKEWEGHEFVMGKMLIEGNCVEYGSNSKPKLSAGRFNGPVEVFWKNNKIVADKSVLEISGNQTQIEEVPFWPPGLVPKNVEDVKKWVLENAGAFPGNRDKIDKRIIAEVRAGEGRIIDSQEDVGGYPNYKPVYRVFKVDEWDMITLTKKQDSKN